MNPPFGGRNGQVPWLRKFMAHGNGIALVAARTSAGWFHDIATSAETMLFPKGKTKFVRPDGSRGGSPGTGIVLLGMGAVANEALRQSGLGLFVPLATPIASEIFEAPYAGHEDMWEARPREPGVVPEAEKKARGFPWVEKGAADG